MPIFDLLILPVYLILGIAGFIPALMLSYLGGTLSLIITAGVYGLIYYELKRRNKLSRAHLAGLVPSCIVMLGAIGFIGFYLMRSHDAQLAILIFLFSGIGVLSSIAAYFIGYIITQSLNKGR